MPSSISIPVSIHPVGLAPALARRLTPPLLVLLTALAALAPPAQAPDDAAPVVVIWRTGGNKLPSPSGLEIAIWEDGSMLFASNPAEPGKNLYKGKCEREDVRAMLDAIRAAGFAKPSRAWPALCADLTAIHVRLDGQRHSHQWHESLNPGFGGNINDDAEYRAFIRMWKRVRGEVESVAPIEVHPVADPASEPAFRGYDFKEPWRTPWISGK